MSNHQCPVGIDLGSSGFVVAVVRRGGIEVLPNDANYRITPSVVVYGEEREAGDPAVPRLGKEFLNSVVGAPRFLGELGPERLDRERFFNPSALKIKSATRAAFAVTSQGRQTEVSPEQVVAALFSKAKRLLALNEVSAGPVVISVPSFFGPAERRATLDAARVAGLDNASLIGESAATVLNYGFFRGAELTEEGPRTVVFVDVGHSKSSVLAAEIGAASGKLLFEMCEPNLGGRSLDLCVFRHYAEIIRQKHNRDIESMPRSKLRLLSAIERQRKQLTANAEATLSIDCLFDEVDFSHTLRREQFVEICATEFTRFEKFLASAASKLGSTRPHAVEKQGGASRVPNFDHLMREAFGAQAINKTTDATESIAKGCALSAAAASATTRCGREFRVVQSAMHEVIGRFKFAGDPSPTDVAIFVAGTQAGETRQIPILKNDALSFELHGPQLLFAGRIEPPRPHAAGAQAAVYFQLDHNLIPQVKGAEIREPKPGESGLPPEGKGRPLHIDLHCYIGLDEETIAAYTAQEKETNERETLSKETDQAKYAFESFAYSVKEKVQGPKYSPLVAPKDKPKFEEAIEEAVRWVETEGLKADKAALDLEQGRLKEKLQPFLDSVKKFDDMNEFVQEAGRKLSGFPTGAQETRKDQKEFVDKGLRLVERVGQTLDSISPEAISNFDFAKTESELETILSELAKLSKHKPPAEETPHAPGAQEPTQPHQSQTHPSQPYSFYPNPPQPPTPPQSPFSHQPHQSGQPHIFPQTSYVPPYNSYNPSTAYPQYPPSAPSYAQNPYSQSYAPYSSYSHASQNMNYSSYTAPGNYYQPQDPVNHDGDLNSNLKKPKKRWF